MWRSASRPFRRRPFTGMNSSTSSTELKRVVGLPGGVLLGLGSMIGTGVFVSIGFGAVIAGPWVLVAIVLAAFVALCNGLSSAQLAAAHPVSGGTYEYGYRYLNPWMGFAAGWTFLIAKSASAATAALGFAYYLARLAAWPDAVLVPVAGATVVIFTLVVITGLRRSNQMNAVIVFLAVASLLTFILFSLPSINLARLLPHDSAPTRFSMGDVLTACALMFVSFTGYGRVATLGEEIHDPRRTIPLGVLAVVAITTLLYLGVASAVVGTTDPAVRDAFGREALLSGIALDLGSQTVALVVTVGAAVAMLGVLLNLLLGLSRVLLAMGRRGDMPSRVAGVNRAGTTPVFAVAVSGVVAFGLTLIGDVRTTWAFSAFAVLIYYGVTNLAALRLNDAARMFPRWISVAGLAACLFLAFQVDVRTWGIGLAAIAFGLVWHAIARRFRRSG